MYETPNDYKLRTKTLPLTGRTPFSQAKKIHPFLGSEVGWKI